MNKKVLLSMTIVVILGVIAILFIPFGNKKETSDTNKISGTFATINHPEATRIQINTDNTFVYVISTCAQYYDEVIFKGTYEIKGNEITLNFNKDYKTNEEKIEGPKYENDVFLIKNKDTIIHDGHTENCGYDGVNNTELMRLK